MNKTKERKHFFETGDRVIWHNEIATIDFPGYRGEDKVRIKLPPYPTAKDCEEFRWVPTREIRHLKLQ